MQNAISTLRIRNFKSIKDMTINPRRVNLIIGEPNVGKSNVLEAMSLLGGHPFRFASKSKQNSGFIRYHEVRQLFHDNNTRQPIVVSSQADISVLVPDWSTGTGYRLLTSDTNTWQRAFDELYLTNPNRGPQASPEEKVVNFSSDWLGKPSVFFEAQYIISQVRADGSPEQNKLHTSTEAYSRTRFVRPYLFGINHLSADTNHSYLEPPTGNNLIQVVEAFPNLRREISQLFAAYGLKLLVRVDERRLEIIKDLDGVIYSYPYSSIADTLQRLIFFLAAIESNDDAVILFEEPEAHSYPVYVSQLGRRIAQSRNNQFFVATHSPYLITEILETMLPDEEQAQEVAIFVAYYEDYQTKLRQLTDVEARGIRNDSLDVFYNMDRLSHPEA